MSIPPYAPSAHDWMRRVAQEFNSYTNINRSISYTGDFALNSLGAVSNGTYVGIGGNSLSFQTLISNPTGADTDNQRASVLIAATTSDDGNSEEQTFCILTTIQTGYSTSWATSTAYSLGANVRANNHVYRCTTAGTSLGSGTGPSGTGTGISDGTAVWSWINDASIDAKVGLYNEVDVKPGAGHSWAQSNNLQIESGVLTDFIINSEFDLTNDCGTDSAIGGPNKYGLYVIAQGGSKSTSGAEITTTNVSTTALLWGLHLSGSKLSSNSVIGIDANSAVGIGIGSGAGAGGAASVTFTTASIVDSATAPIGLLLGGTYSAAPIKFATLPGNYASDAAAATGGVPVGGVYRNGSALMVRAV